MTPVVDLPEIRRIVVTLDSSGGSRPALDIAVRLAAVAGAELEGVFVEDINLIRLSGLPFLREIRACSLVEEVISTESMQRDLRVLARQAENVLQQAALAMGVSCSFRVWRGSTEAEALSTSFEADIVSLCRLRPPTSYRTLSLSLEKPDKPAAAIAAASISILFNASPRADKALAAACQLATDPGVELRVLLPVDEPIDVDLRKRASELLETHAQRVSYLRLGSDSASALASAMQVPANGVLIVEIDHPLLRQAGLSHCLDKLRCPVLLVR